LFSNFLARKNFFLIDRKSEKDEIVSQTFFSLLDPGPLKFHFDYFPGFCYGFLRNGIAIIFLPLNPVLRSKNCRSSEDKVTEDFRGSSTVKMA